MRAGQTGMMALTLSHRLTGSDQHTTTIANAVTAHLHVSHTQGATLPKQGTWCEEINAMKEKAQGVFSRKRLLSSQGHIQSDITGINYVRESIVDGADAT
jgi:hypothetical protein